jgi:NTP pyrophosphatase (non-canonical NTP hydrolase)
MADITLDMLLAMTEALNRRFPKGDDPFQIMTRLLEEGGELAQEINHFEGTGVKDEKHGAPDRMHLAKEVSDVLLGALQVAVHYGITAELRETIERRYQRMRAEGYTKDDQTSLVAPL